jgi:hypothetical protein
MFHDIRVMSWLAKQLFPPPKRVLRYEGLLDEAGEESLCARVSCRAT